MLLNKQHTFADLLISSSVWCIYLSKTISKMLVFNLRQRIIIWQLTPFSDK